MSGPAAAPLRAVLLDIGDTVMRPDPSWEHVYQKAFAEYGIEVPVDQLRVSLREAYRHGGYGFEGGFEATEETSFRRSAELDQEAILALGMEPMPESFFRRLAELFNHTSHWHVFPDAYPALEALRARGLTLGVVSNWVWSLPELLHALELVSHFDFITVSSRVGYEKPHPAIFRHALELAGAEPNEAIHVGDNLSADVAGAQAVGIQPVLIDRHGRVDQPPEGVPLIRSLDELLPIVDSRLAARGASVAGV